MRGLAIKIGVIVLGVSVGLGAALLYLRHTARPPTEFVILGEYHDIIEKQHVARYEYARRFCKQKNVADIACGSGYGMKILAKDAASVDGYDIKNFGFNKVIDLDSQSWDKHYDVIVSFETLEHLSRPDFFLENVRSHADLLVLSTPIGEQPGHNQFHKQTWTHAELKSRLSKYFECGYHYQASDGEKIDDQPRERGYLIGVCHPVRKPND
jgi:2-polyprenyl-3-methyl-5-hydroxy-6-metoxy-1,4-benzoquinol methylase